MQIRKIYTACIYAITIGEEVTGGNIVVDIKYHGFKLKEITENVCDAAKETGKSCPIEPGTQTLTISQELPSIAPSVSCITTIQTQL